MILGRRLQEMGGVTVVRISQLYIYPGLGGASKAKAKTQINRVETREGKSRIQTPD
jgi:hypothetical protein